MCKIPVSEYQEYPNVCGPRPEKSCVTEQKLTCTDSQQCGISLATVVTELPKPSLVLWLLPEESTVASFCLELSLLPAAAFVGCISELLNIKLIANTLADECCSSGKKSD